MMKSVTENKHRSKLSKAQVITIFNSHEPRRVLAERYGIQTSTVNKIKHGNIHKAIIESIAGKPAASTDPALPIEIAHSNLTEYMRAARLI